MSEEVSAKQLEQFRGIVKEEVRAEVASQLDPIQASIPTTESPTACGLIVTLDTVPVSFRS